MDEFETLDELKKRIMPAIETKISEIKANYYNEVTTDDIWEYLKTKWKTEKELTLYDIINDILNLDNETIFQFSERRKKDD